MQLASHSSLLLFLLLPMLSHSFSCRKGCSSLFCCSPRRRPTVPRTAPPSTNGLTGRWTRTTKSCLGSRVIPCERRGLGQRGKRPSPGLPLAAAEPGEDVSGQHILLGSQAASSWARCPILLQPSPDLMHLLFWDFPHLCHD